MARNLLHLNGIEYELQSPVPSSSDIRWVHLEDKIANLVADGHGQPVPFEVIIKGRHVTLQVQPGGVYAAGVAFIEEISTAVFRLD